jgi:hypothetical protein
VQAEVLLNATITSPKIEGALAPGMNNTIKVIISWLIALWASNVFISSLFYKFDNTALEPQHIFGAIGIWISDTKYRYAHPTYQEMK